MGLVYRIDAQDITTMFSDAAEATQITDGTGIYTLVPKTGSSVTTRAIQATSASRPTYRANFDSSGLPAIEFDGTNDTMTIAHSIGWNTTTIIEFFVAMRVIQSASGYAPIIMKYSNGSWNDGWAVTHFTGNFSCGSPSYGQLRTPEVLNAWVLLYGRVGASGIARLRLTNSGVSEFVPTMVVGSNTTPQTNSANVTLGFGPSGNYFKGGIGEIRVYTGGESKATVDATMYDMATRWGLLASQGGSSRPSHPTLQQVIG